MSQKHAEHPIQIMVEARHLYSDHRSDAAALDSTKRAFWDAEAASTKKILLSDKERNEFFAYKADLEVELGQERAAYHDTLRLSKDHLDANLGVYEEEAANMARSDGVELHPRIIDKLPGNMGMSFTTDIETGDAEHMDLMFLVAGVRGLSRDLYEKRNPTQDEVRAALEELYGVVLELGNIALGLQQPKTEL